MAPADLPNTACGPGVRGNAVPVSEHRIDPQFLIILIMKLMTLKDWDSVKSYDDPFYRHTHSRMAQQLEIVNQQPWADHSCHHPSWWF
jgi:hypothetical protein